MTVSETNDSIRITGVCGSLSADGVTKKALAIALKGASEYNAETALLELRDFNLVFYGSVPQDEYPPDVIQLRQALKDSQGIILATPEYHGSLTGALKNMLERNEDHRVGGRSRWSYRGDQLTKYNEDDLS